MKRFRHALGCCFGLVMGLLLPIAVPAEPDPIEIKVLTWSEYIDPEVVAAFESSTGIKVAFTYYESDEARDDMLIATNGVGYDVIMGNSYSMQLYRRQGWLAPVTVAEVPNLRHIDPRWLKHDAGVAGYGVPYFWGTLGIAYRSDLVSQPLRRWADLLDPPAELHGRIAMIANTRELIGVALLARGHSMNSTDLQALDEARQILLRQKPHVKTYSYLSLSEESSLVKGEVWAAQMYSGDVLMLQEHDPNIIYVVPEEGTNTWLDVWAVSAYSANKAAAYRFIDFMNIPEQAAQNALFVHYATPNMSADRLLPASYHEDPVIFPPADVVQRSERFEMLPPRVMRAWNAVFSEIIH